MELRMQGRIRTCAHKRCGGGGLRAQEVWVPGQLLGIWLVLDCRHGARTGYRLLHKLGRPRLIFVSLSLPTKI